MPSPPDVGAATRFIRGDIERTPTLAGLTGLGGPDGELTMMGDESALGVLACEDSPLSAAAYRQVLVNVADEVPLAFKVVGCP